MDKVAHLPAQDRRDLFSEAASTLGIRPTIIEKDFWVCFVLKQLFVESPFKEHLVFKGGTSLSKVYRLIERFSEDIDLVLDWKLLGIAQGFDDPAQGPRSKTQQDRFNKKVNQLAAEFIHTTLCPQLDLLLRQAGIELSASVDQADDQIVNIRYPAAFSEAYIRPEVRLEIGPLASWVPSAVHTIAPYAFQAFPRVFDNPCCPVLAIVAERTFWEKTTILHQEAHREALIPSRHSRHYYDLYKLAQSPIRDSALGNLQLLKEVVEFKERFYPSNWARYDLAIPGSLKLLPTSAAQLAGLERDYKDMQMMLFGERPSFSTIVHVLRELEQQLNALPSI
jgi:hypothetical protein